MKPLLKISFVISLLLFLFTYHIDEEEIFQKHFSNSLGASISGFLDLHNFGELEKNERGFAEVLEILNAKTETGSIEKIRNSYIVGAWPHEEVTYQLVGINELGEEGKVLGEATLAKEALIYIAEQKYKEPYINFFKKIRTLLGYTAAVLGLIELAKKNSVSITNSKS